MLYAKGLAAKSPAGRSYKEHVAVAFPILGVPCASLKRCKVIMELKEAMMTPGCRLLGFSASINDLLVAGIQGFQRDGDRDEYTSYFKCSLPTPHDDPLSVITVDTLSYVMTTENRAFIERTSASDPDKTFSINWISYTLQLMLGAEHYGLQVGEIFHGDRRATKDGIHTQSEKTNWWCYNLPPPALGNAVVPFSKKRGFYTTQHDIRVGRGVAGLGRWSFQ